MSIKTNHRVQKYKNAKSIILKIFHPELVLNPYIYLTWKYITLITFDHRIAKSLKACQNRKFEIFNFTYWNILKKHRGYLIGNWLRSSKHFGGIRSDQSFGCYGVIKGPNRMKIKTCPMSWIKHKLSNFHMKTFIRKSIFQEMYPISCIIPTL